MIKNRITPEIRKAFLEEIKESRYSGREQGFLICLENSGKLSVSKKRCIGEECGFVVKDVTEYCHDKVQGAFHTHPYFINIERFYGRKPTEKETEHAIRLYRKNFERKGINLTTPSHHDTVNTLMSQCTGETEGTVCTGTDLDLDDVECWTVKGDKVKIRDCSRAREEFEERIGEQPRKWIKPLFDREIISLKEIRSKLS